MIDAHCHFDIAENPIKYISENEKKKMVTIGMTNLPSHFQLGMHYIQRYRYIRLALGLHPLRAKEHLKEHALFKRLHDKTSYIGEVGLDFSREGIATKETQINSFEFVLDQVKDKRKILSIHSRRAEKETLEMLIVKDVENAIFHWYSGNMSVLKNIIQSGYYFSINTAMTQSENGRRIIEKIPKEQILTETDFPFIKNSSIYQAQLYLSQLWDIPITEVDRIINSNFQKLIRNIK